jgi:integrase
VKLTRDALNSLTLPAGKLDHVYWDDSLPGFGCRLRGSRKTWLVQYRIRGRQHRESLGDIRKVSLESARGIARKRFAQIELGVDPSAERAAARLAEVSTALTFKSVAERYLDTKKSALRSSTYNAAVLHFTTHWAPFATLPIGTIGRADIAARLQALVKERGKVAAARARANLSALFAWAMREGLVDSNPTIATNRPDAGTRPRERVLSNDEIVAIWNASDNDNGRIIRLLILLGCRRQEIGSLLWREIDLENGLMTISGERAKNHRTSVLALPPVALEILRSIPPRGEYVFGRNGFRSWSDLKAEIDERSRVSGWTWHDVRRTAATGMNEIGIAPHLVEQILNHQSGHKRGVAGVYNKSVYANEVRIALVRWAEHIASLVEGRASKVLAFPA